MLTLDELSIRHATDDIIFYLERGRDVLAILGALYATKLCLNVACTCMNIFKVYLLPKIWSPTDLASKYGKWAVITGASEGIGRAYAIELAKRKMNVVLVSRSSTKLEKVASEIEKSYNVETKIIAADLCLMESYLHIANEVKDLEVGILVNNFGVMYDHLQYFLTVEYERLERIIISNIMATVLMTRLFLPDIVKRKKGAIINLSSGSCVKPVPCMTAYSAAKEYVDCFSQALNYEYGGKGIVIQSVQPFYVSTRMTKFMRPNFLVPTAETYVQHSLRTLSFTSRTYGYWSHGLMGFIGNLLPKWLFFWSCININVPLWNYFAGTSANDLSKMD